MFVNVAVSWNDCSARRPNSDIFLRWVIQDDTWVESPGSWRGSEWGDVCPADASWSCCSVSVGGDGGEGVIGRKSSDIRRRISGLSVTIDCVLNLSFWGVCGLLGSFVRSGVLLERDDSPHTRMWCSVPYWSLLYPVSSLKLSHCHQFHLLFAISRYFHNFFCTKIRRLYCRLFVVGP